jgi:hypothetical protein
MTNITRVIKDLIEANTYAEITANVGNTEPVTIDSIVYADQTWANTSNTSVPVTGGYIKLYGKSFEPNANILFGSTVGTANVQSSTEVRVNVPALATGTYTLFLYNPSGSNAIRYKSIPVQGDYNYGWFTGGQSGTTIISSVERIDFNNDTVNTNIRASFLSPIVFASSGGTNDNGYIFGGSQFSSDSPTPSSFNSQVVRFTYANDESSPLSRVGISPATQRWRSTTSSKNYAYTSGGFDSTTSINQPAKINTDRLDFSNDSASLTTKGPLSIGRLKMTSASDNNYGWYIGGAPTSFFYSNSPTNLPYTVNALSIIDRLNFNSDTTTAIVRGPLNIGSAFLSSSKNSINAWIFSGITTHNYVGPTVSHNWTGSSSIQRMTFASDNLTTLTRVPAGYSSAASVSTGDENYGWITGGTTLNLAAPGTPLHMNSYDQTTSSIFRLTYATDTTTATSRSSFFQSKKYHTGISGVVS